jgi:hypothetical protein
LLVSGTAARSRSGACSAWPAMARDCQDAANDDVIAEYEDEVAVVHLTWTQQQERQPWPLTTFMASADEFESHVASEYDWEP